MRRSFEGLGVGNQESIVWCWGLLSGAGSCLCLEVRAGSRREMSAPCPLDGTLGLLGHPPDAAAGSPRAGDAGEQGECGSACWGAS